MNDQCFIYHRVKQGWSFCTQTQPVEEFYRKRGKLLEFELPGGIPQSWPKLLRALHLEDDKQSAIA